MLLEKAVSPKENLSLQSYTFPSLVECDDSCCGTRMTVQRLFIQQCTKQNDDVEQRT